MQANRIFVIPLGYDQSGELVQGAKALCEKLSSKGQKVAYLPQGKRDGLGASGQELLDGLDTEENVGVYILGHHGREISGLGNHTPAEVAKVITDLGFKHLRKLCLVACRLDTAEPAANIAFAAGERLDKQASLIKEAAHLKDKNTKLAGQREQQAKDAQTNAQASFMGQLASGLAASGLRPMIAGWDSFVTVCYAGNKAIKDFAGANVEANQGRKVFSESKSLGGGGPYLFGSPKDGEDVRTSKRPHKVVVRWALEDGKGVLVRADEGWSDKQRG